MCAARSNTGRLRASLAQLSLSVDRALPAALATMREQLASDFAPVMEDRALEAELRLCLSHIRNRHWGLYA